MSASAFSQKVRGKHTHAHLDAIGDLEIKVLVPNVGIVFIELVEFA
jgi:hypothetical protein